MVRARSVGLSWQLALVLIVLLGGSLRFHGLGWDEPSGAASPLQMHPDERFLSLVGDHLDWPSSLGQYFDTAKSPLNPYNDPDTHSFVYGTFPLFLAKGVSTVTGHLPGEIGVGALQVPLPNGHGDPPGVGNSYDKTIYWGRILTALFDTGTIVLVFALGWTLFGRKAALVGALLYALAVLPTQLAHFWTMDPFLTFFGALTLLQAVHYVSAKRDRTAWAFGIGAGVTLGLASACKVNAALMLPVIPLAAALRIGLRDLPVLGLRWHGERVAAAPGERRNSGAWLIDIAIVSFSIAAALIVFRIAQPYAFTGPHFWDMSLNTQWKTDLQREYDFQNGAVDYPPFVQFAGRTPFLTPLRNMVLFGLGPALGLAAWIALAAGAVLMFKRRELLFALPLAFVGAIFTFQGMRFVAFMRYFEPMYPVLCAFAGWGVVAAWRATRSMPEQWTRLSARRGAVWRRAEALSKPRNARIALAAAFVMLFGSSVWWAMAFQGIYNTTNSRIAASEWIYANIPAGSSLTNEIWDDSLPYALPNASAIYRGIALEPYTTDSQEKVTELIYGRPQDKGRGGLVNADYVVLASTRVRNSVVRLEREYPATIRYYQLLDSGALGFEKVASFDSHPTFLGLSVNDSSAEESFTVYDHPEVTIYKKTAAFDPQKALALLDEAHPERAVNLLPNQGRTNGLQYTAAAAASQQAGGTFDDVFDAHGWASHVPWVWWLLFIEIAALASLPWVTWVFRALPDYGYGLSKILGLSAVVLPTWMLVAWGGPTFSESLVWGVFASVIAVGAAISLFRWRTVVHEARARWATWVTIEAAFLLAFGLFLLLRYFNPDLWYDPQGGEKPMEMASLTAITRSTHLPPYDPWFSGGTMNYYYMGWFFMAVPIRALRLLPEYAFNLGVPTFAALGASVAASTISNLVSVSARARGAAAGGGERRWRRPALFAGVFAAVLLIGIGNLDGGAQMIQRLQSVNHWSFASRVPFVGGVVGFFGGGARWLFAGASLPPFDWWRSSRVHFGTYDITEFPYWSLLFGDVHPHMMDVPFFGLVIALSAAYVLSVRAGLRAQAWVLVALIGLGVGVIRTLHTWDFATAALIGFGGIGAGQLLAKGRWQTRWWIAIAQAVTAAAVLVIAFIPYNAHFETFDPGVIRAVATTKPHQYFAQFGLFVAFALAFLAVRYHEELLARHRDHGRNPFLATVNGKLELGALVVFVTGLSAFTWMFGLTTIALGVLFELYLFNLLWMELRSERRDVPRMLATVMFALAFGISVGVDVVTIKNDLERMNTVFKFYIQAWQLFALGSAFAAWYVGRALWEVRGWRIRPVRKRATWALGTSAVIGVLLLGASVFVVSGTKVRQNARFAETGPTLNGLAYLKQAEYREVPSAAHPEDATIIKLEDDEPLIRWLRANVHGSPVITEAVGDLYHWTGRMSVNTGLPAVIGWDFHQTQQRAGYVDLVDRRRFETAQFYTDGNQQTAEQYLLRYNVSYVIVGTEEHVHGTPAGLAKIAKMPELTEVFRSGDNVIYHVDQSKLPIPLVAVAPGG